jgi:hypothetical protein
MMRTLQIKTELDVPGVNFSLDDFKVETQKIRDASEFCEALDDYQYQMCKICKGLGKDDEEWRKYNKLRVTTLQLMTTLRVILIAFKNDPESERANLYGIVQRLQSLTSLLTNNVFHYKLPEGSTERIYTCSCSKSFNSQKELQDHLNMMSDASDFNQHQPTRIIPQIELKTLSEALNIAGLTEKEVEKFLRNLKLSTIVY